MPLMGRWALPASWSCGLLRLAGGDLDCWLSAYQRPGCPLRSSPPHGSGEGSWKRNASSHQAIVESFTLPPACSHRSASQQSSTSHRPLRLAWGWVTSIYRAYLAARHAGS